MAVSSDTPFQYRDGHVQFHGRTFAVDPRALIPRFETEVLVDRVVAWCAQHPLDRPWHIADIGTGSGIIAISLASALPTAAVVAVDISPGALALARQNAVTNHVSDRIQFRHGSLLSPVSESLDIIVANLPYIPTERIATLDPEVRNHEPRTALDGGADGFDCYRQLIAGIAQLERKPQFCIFEIDDGQQSLAAQTVEHALPGAHYDISLDASGLTRYFTITL